MNRVKINVKASDYKNYKYHIYRSTSQEDLQPNLNKLQLLTEALIIDETTSSSAISTTVFKETISLDKSYIPKLADTMTPFLLRYKPLPKNNDILVVTINFNNANALITNENIKLELTLNTSGGITNLVITHKDKTVETITTGIGETVMLKEATIMLNNELIDGYYDISCSYNIELLEGTDIAINGIKKPVVKSEYFSYDKSTNVSTPCLKLKPHGSENGIMYYYRTVCIDSLGNVSDPSPLISHNLCQNKDDIIYHLEQSTDYSKELDAATWTELLTAPPDAEILLGKSVITTPNYISTGSLCVNKVVPTIEASSISTSDVYVNSDNKLILTIPNVWHCKETKYNLRDRVAYRVKAVIDNEESEYSDIIFKEDKVHIDVEKMIVIKRNCTHDVDQTTPSTVNQVGTNIINSFIRKNGLYYTELEHGQYPYNIPYPNTHVVVMSRLSVFSHITINDSGCALGQSYNYTIYLYDSFGNISEPTSIVIKV